MAPTTISTIRSILRSNRSSSAKWTSSTPACVLHLLLQLAEQALVLLQRGLGGAAQRLELQARQRGGDGVAARAPRSADADRALRSGDDGEAMRAAGRRRRRAARRRRRARRTRSRSSRPRRRAATNTLARRRSRWAMRWRRSGATWPKISAHQLVGDLVVVHRVERSGRRSCRRRASSSRAPTLTTPRIRGVRTPTSRATSDTSASCSTVRRSDENGRSSPTSFSRRKRYSAEHQVGGPLLLAEHLDEQPAAVVAAWRSTASTRGRRPSRPGRRRRQAGVDERQPDRVQRRAAVRAAERQQHRRSRPSAPSGTATSTLPGRWNATRNRMTTSTAIVAIPARRQRPDTNGASTTNDAGSVGEPEHAARRRRRDAGPRRRSR